MKKDEITIEEEKELQEGSINYLKMIQKRNKNQGRQKTLANLNMLFNGRNDVINFIEGYIVQWFLRLKEKLLKN